MSRLKLTLVLASAVAIGSVGTLAVLWMSGLAWHDESSNKAFCEKVQNWRDAALNMEKVSNSVDRSTAAGRQAMNDAFKPVATVVIPISEGDEARLAEVAAKWLTAEEEFLSEASLYYVLVSDSSTATNAQRVDAFGAMEDARLRANDLLRRVNPFLASECSIAAIDPYLK